MMVLFANDNVEVIYDANSYELLQIWRGYVPTEMFREVIDLSVSFVRNNRVELLISDTSQQKVVSGSDADYAALVLGMMLGYGLKVMAFVLPHDVFTRFSLKKFADASHSDQVGYFEHIEEARKWSRLFK